MVLDPKNYLNLAHFLISDACNSLDREACLRSSLGRAYYSALLFASYYAGDTSSNFKPSRKTFHEDVRKWYHMQGKFSVEEDLNDLQQWRNQCDYDREIRADLERLVSKAIEIAENIINTCYINPV